MVKGEPGTPPRFGRIIYTESARKVAYFIETAARERLPLLFVQDVSGFMVGPDAEQSGIIRAGAEWVEAMATHYRGKVRDWAMWNEPDINKQHKPGDIAAFNIRTAEIIKRIIPDARIAGLSLASSSPKLLDDCLKAVAARGKVDLFHWFIYHGYALRPDSSYKNVEGVNLTPRAASLSRCGV